MEELRPELWTGGKGGGGGTESANLPHYRLGIVDLREPVTARGNQKSQPHLSIPERARCRVGLGGREGRKERTELARGLGGSDAGEPA